MTDLLISDGPAEDLDVFECPNCKETIDTSAKVCRFCGAKVNHEGALNASHLLAKVDQACSDASYMRITGVIAFCLPVGTLIGIFRNPRFIQQVGFENILIGVCALALVVSSPFPIWTLSWWRKNANLASDDEEFQTARGVVRKVGYIATSALLVCGSLFCMILFFKFSDR